MELKALTTDTAKEQNGVWIDFDSDTKFLIGSLNGRRYRESFTKRYEELRRKYRTNIPTAASEDASHQCYAEAILLDWKNVVNDGKPFLYIAENALWVIKNCPSIRDFVFAAAANNENFRIEKLEEAKAKLGES